MFHVTCSLPNASTEISGIAFELIDEEDRGGPDPVRTVRTIEPVDAETAKLFRDVPGYTVAPVIETPTAPAAATAAAFSAAVAAGAEPPVAPRRGRPSKAELEARAAAAAAQTDTPPVADTAEVPPPPPAADAEVQPDVPADAEPAADAEEAEVDAEGAESPATEAGAEPATEEAPGVF